MRVQILGLLVVAVAGQSCGESVSPPPAPKPELIQLTLSSTAADTIHSPLVRTLVVTVTDSAGHPLPHTTVRVYSRYVGIRQTIHLSTNPTVTLAAPPYLDVSINWTDEIELYARPGIVSGTHYLIAEVLGTSVKDSIAVTVLPGQPYMMTVTPADTTILVGEQYQLNVTVTDRGQNKLQGQHSVQSLHTDVVVYGLPPNTVSALGPGRATLRVTANAIVRDVTVNVPR